MRFQPNLFAGIAALALPVAAQAVQSQPTNEPAARSADTAPDEATAGTAGTAAQPQSPASDRATAAKSTSTQQPSGEVKPASLADVKNSAAVYDQNGDLVGKIESASSKGAVVNTGSTRASIPVSSFAKNDKGLVLSMTKAQLEAAAKKKGAK